MELLGLTLRNFKRFTEGEFNFVPGLNLIWGTNESGKSTIHEAICCALFGRERGKAVENWNGGDCSISLSYRSSGKDYRIERRVTEGAARLGSIVDGELTDTVSSRDEIDRVLADHLGITSRQVFDNTVSVRQVSMSSPQPSDMEIVGSEIQRVLTGTAHVSAAEVIKKLEARRSAVKGKARPTNPRELDKIVERLHKLAEDLADARRSRAQIRSLEEELESLQVRVDRNSDRLGVLTELIDRHSRWAQLGRRQAEKTERHQSVFATLQKLKSTLSKLKAAQKELEGYTDLVGKDDEISEHLAKVRIRREELEGRLSELESVGAETRPAPGVSPTVFLAFSVLLAASGISLGFLVSQLLFLLLAPAVAMVFIYLLMRSAGGAKQQMLADSIESVRQELKQLATEEKSILSYINCRSMDEASARIKAYRALVPRVHELDVSMNALLGGRRMEDWETEETDLARELSTIERELEEDFKDYSPNTQETESWRSEYASLQNSLPTAQARLHEVRGSLEAEKRNARDLASLEGEIEYLHSRKAELEFTHRAYEEAISALSAVTQTVSEEYLPVLSERASNTLQSVTSGRYQSVSISPGWEASLDSRDKTGISPSALSIGTLDQLYFALRIACGELLSSGRKLPVILDDPFASFDRDRLDNVLNLLETLAVENQIILLTHDLYVLDWARRLHGIPTAIHELAGPNG